MSLQTLPTGAGGRTPPAEQGVRIGAPDAGSVPRIDPTPRPHRNLLVYYALTSLLLGPFFWAMLIPQFFRYRTLRYRFDDEGVTMRWGVLFRREISLTYARIQDIHLTSNVVERWLGLARIQVQTASGNAGAEMTIEGLTEFEAVRDFLYSRMRGTRERGGGADVPTGTSRSAIAAGEMYLPAESLDQLTATLRAVAEELRALRLERGEATREPGGEVPRG